MATGHRPQAAVREWATAASGRRPEDDVAMNCPECQSTRTRRGGNAIWTIYVTLIALALVAVLVFGFNAAIVAAIVIAASVIAHLTIGGHVCLDCGHQFR